LAVLSGDYFSIPDEEIKRLESVLTIVGGKVVYAAEEFSNLAPPPLPVSPSWSPIKEYGGYANASKGALGASHSRALSAVCPDRAPRITTFQCWVILGSGIWDAIVSPFEKWQPNS
jgi:Predicted metal-dependent hydrolase with the TIM-barrel fold